MTGAVFGCQLFKVSADGGFALPLGQIKALGAHAGRDVGKKRVQTAHANYGEHFMQLFRRMGDVWHMSSLNSPRLK